MARFTDERGFTMIELAIVVLILAFVVIAIAGVHQTSQLVYTRAASLEDAQLQTRAALDLMARDLRLAGAFWVSATGATDAIELAETSKLTFYGDVDADTLTTAGIETLVSADAAALATTISLNATTGFSDGEYLYVANGSTREVKRITGVTAGTVTVDPGLANGYVTNSIARSVEKITYELSGTTLYRKRWTGTTEPLLSDDDIIAENVTGLTFSYYRTCFAGTGVCVADPTCPFSPDAGGNQVALTAPVAAACRPQIFEIRISLTIQGNDGSQRTLVSQIRPRNLTLIE